MSVNNSPSIESRDLSQPDPLHDGNARGRVFAQLDRMDYAIRFFAIAATVCLVATIIFIALAQAQYVHPLIGLGIFGGCIASFIAIKCIDCCQRRLAEENKISLDIYYERRQPRPPMPAKKKKVDN